LLLASLSCGQILSRTDVKKDAAAPEFSFKARFYPENAAEELIQDITRVRQ